MIGWLMRQTQAGCVLVLALVSCGDRAIELDRVCVRTRLLPISPDTITRSGRTLSASGWHVGQIELDGSVTAVTSLEVDVPPLYLGRLDHDPVSGRMWVLAWAGEEPAWLYQFDAAGQVEWANELVGFAGPIVSGGSLRYHDDSIVFAVTIQTQSGYPSLLIERRDLAGETLWTRDDISMPDDVIPFRSAELIGVSGDALSMIATPPLIDYGPSFPLTLDVATGDTIWSGPDGHDPLRMIVDDEHLFLAWMEGPRYDPEQLPEQVEIAPASSSLSQTTPSGEQLTQDNVEWPKGWRTSWDDKDLEFAWMGERVVTLVEGSEQFGVTVHAKDGTLECQGTLDVEIDGIASAAMGIEGREQWLLGVYVGVGEPNKSGYYDESVRSTLLLEPL
jgi:hypothetical protein